MINHIVAVEKSQLATSIFFNEMMMLFRAPKLFSRQVFTNCLLFAVFDVFVVRLLVFNYRDLNESVGRIIMIADGFHKLGINCFQKVNFFCNFAHFGSVCPILK